MPPAYIAYIAISSVPASAPWGTIHNVSPRRRSVKNELRRRNVQKRDPRSTFSSTHTTAQTPKLRPFASFRARSAPPPRARCAPCSAPAWTPYKNSHNTRAPLASRCGAPHHPRPPHLPQSRGKRSVQRCATTPPRCTAAAAARPSGRAAPADFDSNHVCAPRVCPARVRNAHVPSVSRLRARLRAVSVARAIAGCEWQLFVARVRFFRFCCCDAFFWTCSA